MSRELQEFCELIGKEYSYFLYKNDESYPFNCHTSANLISSFISVYYEGDFTHRKLPAHGVSMGNDCVIDFTEFQFELSEAEKCKLKDSQQILSKEQLYKLVKKKPIYESKESRLFQLYTGFHEKGGLTICELYCKDYAQRISNPYTLEGFMQYVEKAFKFCKTKVTRNGLY